ncbi:Bacterial type II secretion system protein F domain protein [Thalassoglobus neptunius]|uniref:Bacterial type II secretion system protein F domain protein n=1 Tax=Thalassoglobus neptunius TaxID=1938619 RepID=A0A5C5X6H3_9PLAN|nr:type II secretion system F family protein [Thalassoglobus neptunius]TWT58249.1 Bacterial type II secretion system protein F domain protein [Thalassoglobus neptunius]
MEMTTFIPYAVFAAVMLGIWAIVSAFSKSDSRVAERLEELKEGKKRRADGDSIKESGVSNAFKKAAPALSRVVQPKTDLEQNNLKVKLANAGFSSPNAPTLYLAIKVACLALGIFLGGGLGFLTMGLSTDAMLVLIGCGGLGLFLPGVFLTLLAYSRKQKIFLSLPDALDLLVVCVEAGLGLDAAMRRVAEELGDASPEICTEFNHCNKQLQLGRNRREVLHDLGIRTGVDDVKALAAILIQADKFGSSIAQALRVQSDSMRVKRSQLAEEKAAATAVKMIFPLVLFIFPGIFVVLVGPAAIMMIRELLTQ